jgi:C4-dicarboxylate transporter DctM subunit
MLFGAISGSGAAAIAAIGSVMVPKMTEAGYDRGYATALVACSSVLALLIPPSIPMIVFALTAGLPVSACFLSTVGPGLIIGGLYIAMNRQTTRQQGVDRPQAQKVQRLPGASLRAVPALLMPVLMLGGIYSGAFTPTEAAAVALTYGVLVGLLIYRTLGLADVARCFVEGGAVCASVIAILIFLLVFGKLLALEQIPGHLSSALLSISDNYYVVLLMINVVLLIIGMFLDDISGSILAAVILLPVAREVGVDPIHFAAIVGTNLGLGNVTPPCAPLLFVAGSVTGLDLHAFLRPALRLMLMGHLPVVLLVTYVPALGTLLPGLLL